MGSSSSDRSISSRGCAVSGGCLSDYIAIAISILAIVVLLARAVLPYLLQKATNIKASGFSLIYLQIIGSINLIFSIVMSSNLVALSRRRPWQSCYVWAVWIEGPLGFGLLMSCRIVHAYQLYHLFVKRRLPPVKPYILLPLTVFPWVCEAAGSGMLYALGKDLKTIEPRELAMACVPFQAFPVIHVKRPLNHLCHMQRQWVIPVVCIHGLYVATLLGITRSLRRVEFRFHEFKDLLQGIIVSTIAIGKIRVDKSESAPNDGKAGKLLWKLSCNICPVSVGSWGLKIVLEKGLWVAAYIVNEVHEDMSWVQVSSRFLLLLMASILVLAIFSMSVSQPLLSQISLRKRETLNLTTMSQALGLPDIGLHKEMTNATARDLNQPLEKLLTNKRFRQSFMAFADSCLAGESVHFFEEAQELSKISVDDPVSRVYMARHLIEQYIASGAEMEVNISHRTRQEILGTSDLAHPNLFDRAVSEVIHLIKTNLEKDYWSSIYSVRFEEESVAQNDDFEHMGRDFSPRLSCGHCDDPFHQESVHKCSG